MLHKRVVIKDTVGRKGLVVGTAACDHVEVESQLCVVMLDEGVQAPKGDTYIRLMLVHKANLIEEVA